MGSLIEKNEYAEYYYVNMFPENDKSKKYKVKAEISARYDENESTNNDGNITTYDVRHYYIEKADFSNGGYITFNADEPLELNKKVSLVDDDDKNWNIEMINEKVKP